MTSLTDAHLNVRSLVDAGVIIIDIEGTEALVQLKDGRIVVLELNSEREADLWRMYAQHVVTIQADTAGRIKRFWPNGDIESEDRSIKPPEAAESLIAFFTPPKVREAVLGDLAEAFEDNVVRLGPKAAARSYWWHVIGGGVSFLGPRLIALLGLDAILRKLTTGG